MKRALTAAAAGLAVAASTFAVAPSANAAPSGLPDHRCVYKVVTDTKLYDDRSWGTNIGFFDKVGEGTWVAGPCDSSGGWTWITHLKWMGKWTPVHAFSGDQDFMRTWTLDYSWMS